MDEVAMLLEALLAETGASRVTLRRGDDAGYAFPVTDEALAPGVASLRYERTVELRTQPVAGDVRRGVQVVQHDSRNAYDDPAFQRMLEVYGDVAAQIVTPVASDGEVGAILSVHQLGTRRQWTREDTEACRRTAARLAQLL